MKTILPLLTLSLLTGCITAAQPTTQPAVTLTKDPNAVARCQSLGEVHGSSLLGGVVQSQGYENTLADVKNQAAGRGGTHVLLMDVSSGHMGSNALGSAYRCG